MVVAQETERVSCLNMGSCRKQDDVFCPVAAGEQNGMQCPDFSPVAQRDALTVEWGIPDSRHTTFRRAGKEVMGCGWCGHNNPEG